MQNVLRGPRMMKTLTPVLVTGLTSIVLILFLIPFVYMVMTSLKTQAQFTLPNAPIWPAAAPKDHIPEALTGIYTVQVNKAGTLVDETIDVSAYAGQDLEVYSVPM